MGAEAAALHTRLALEHAKDYNDLCDLLSVRAEAGSAAATTAIGNGSRKEEVRISLQMPERYNGTTDFSAWLRRYENTANAAGWSSGTKAARLGMYLTDEYYEMWDQYAPKVTFEEDSRIMSQMLARRPADALLDNFHDLRWAPGTNVGTFLAKARRMLTEYNKKLTDEKKLSDGSLDQMILNKLIALAPAAAKAELRRRQPSKIEEMVDIISDYTPAMEMTSASSPALQQVEAKLQKVLAAVTTQTPNTNATIQQMVEKIQDLEKRLAGQQRPSFRRPGVCGICRGPHATKDCAQKKFSTGCYLCGGDGHLARSCPTRRGDGSKAGPSSSGN